MKKTFFILFLCFIVLLSVGCENDKLACSKDTDEGNEEVIFTFKDGKAYEVDGKTIYTFESKEKVDEAKEFSNFYSLAYSLMGASSKVEIDGLNLVIYYKGNIANMKEKLESLNKDSDSKSNNDVEYSSSLPFNSSMSKKELKDEIIKNGYICK